MRPKGPWSHHPSTHRGVSVDKGPNGYEGYEQDSDNNGAQNID